MGTGRSWHLISRNPAIRKLLESSENSVQAVQFSMSGAARRSLRLTYPSRSLMLRHRAFCQGVSSVKRQGSLPPHNRRRLYLGRRTMGLYHLQRDAVLLARPTVAYVEVLQLPQAEWNRHYLDLSEGRLIARPVRIVYDQCPLHADSEGACRQRAMDCGAR